MPTARNKSRIKSAKAHIVSRMGSPRVVKKKESLKTRAKISATKRKRCEVKKWGSSSIWPSCRNKNKYPKSIKPTNGKCPSGFKIRRAYTTALGTKVPARCIKSRSTSKNKKLRSARAHVISQYGSPKVVKKRKLKTRTKISKTRKVKGLDKKKWGSKKIWR